MSPLLVGIPAPAEGAGLIVENLAGLFVNNKNKARDVALFKRGIPEEVGISQAYEIYDVGLVSCARNALSGAKLAGWKYFIFDGKELLGQAEMTFRPQGNKTSFASISPADGWARSALKELLFLESTDEVRRRDFFLRFLRIVSLSIFAIWLRPKDPGFQEQLVLVEPTNEALRNRPPRVLDGSVFNTRVRVIAQERLATGDNVVG
jgi:hypothetical protein